MASQGLFVLNAALKSPLKLSHCPGCSSKAHVLMGKAQKLSEKCASKLFGNKLIVHGKYSRDRGSDCSLGWRGTVARGTPGCPLRGPAVGGAPAGRPGKVFASPGARGSLVRSSFLPPVW